MATITPARALLKAGDPDKTWEIGIAQPNLPWSLRQHDRARGVLIAGGQGSGKSSKLIRYAYGDALASNTALIVFDMKGSLAERLLTQIPTDIPKRYYDHDAGEWREATKRVWYLDLAAPAFGLTPLHVEPGWTKAALPNEFVRIAGLVVHSLLDLFPGQIFQSSEDIIERAVIGTMAIAFHEHHQRHAAAGTSPEASGFSGSFEVLAKMFAPTDRHAVHDGERRSAPKPNPWHEAAGRACQQIRGLAAMAEQLLYEIPGQVRANLHGMEQRMAAPYNKLGPLIYSHAAVRQFVEHPERLSLQSVIEAHDILIINPRKDILGDGSQPEILTNFVIHMINAQLNRQISYTAPTRPRLSLVIDEAHTLITPTLMRMVSSHREAGLSVACATQYMSQIGATIEDPAKRAYVQNGVTNLLQTKMFGRMSDPQDAEAAAAQYRSVWESVTRGDPTSQARIPVDASNIMTLEDYHFLVHAISSGEQRSSAPRPAATPRPRTRPRRWWHRGCRHDAGIPAGPSAGQLTQPGWGTGGWTGWGGSTALPVFVSRACPMAELHVMHDTFRAEHLRRMRDVFGAYREDLASDRHHTIPEGLGGARAPVPTEPTRDRNEAHDVAADTVGRRPAATQPSDAEAREWERAREAPPSHADEDEPAQRPEQEVVGGTRIQRAPPRDQAPHSGWVPLFEFAMRRATSPPPPGDLPPAGEQLAEAVRYAASIEQLDGLGAWSTAGAHILRDADRKARDARQSALLAGRAEGLHREQLERRARDAATKARRAELSRHTNEPWQLDIGELQRKITADQMQTLEVLARLPLSHPSVLALLLNDPPGHRTIVKNLRGLEDAGLIASSPVKIIGQGGRPKMIYAVTARGCELRQLDRHATGTQGSTPHYLRSDRKLPSDGKESKGTLVPHALAVQLVTGALRRYGGTAIKVRWLTPDMPGGRLDVDMLHKHDHKVHLRDLTPPDGPPLAVIGERADTSGVIEPDVSLAFDGPVAGTQRSLSVLLEIDRTERPAYNAKKFIAYDHFLAGWCTRLRKFARARPLVVFVCQSPKAALTMLSHADELMTVGIGLAGHDHSTYQYFGRTHTAFTCMNWLLAGQAYALRMAPAPPTVRGDAPWEAEAVALLPESWWVKQPTSAAVRQTSPG